MKTFIKLDYFFQTFLIYTTVFSIFIFPFGLLSLIALGAWQLMSGLITGLCFQKLTRKYYLPKALVYLGFIYVFTHFDLLPTFLEQISLLLGLLFWVIFPFCIGVWYYLMTKKDYKKFKKRAPLKPIRNGLAMNCPYEEEEDDFYFDNWAA